MEKTIHDLLLKLEERSLRGPGLFPVNKAGDFYRMAVLYLGVPLRPLEELSSLSRPDVESLLQALESLDKQPSEAAVWVNHILLGNRETDPSLIPAGARREDSLPSARLLADLLRGENTCPSPSVRSAF